MRKRKCSTNEGINNVYTVETIYKKKSRNNKEPLYFIKWKDWDDKYNTWEPLSNILDHSLIETFEDEIRQKQKLRKETNKNKIIDSNKFDDYESDVKSIIENEKEISAEPVDTSDIIMPEKSKDEILPDIEVEAVCRPKICIKIPKYRIHPPHSSAITNSLSKESNSPDIEKARHSTNESEDDQLYMCRLSPIYFSKDVPLNKPPKDQLPCHDKSPKKEHVHKVSKKHLYKLPDNQIKKPRKLLSINEYSAAIKMKKKHHKKSKHSKHRSENRIPQPVAGSPKPVLCSDKLPEPKTETKKHHDEKPSESTVDKVEPVSQVKSTTSEEAVKDRKISRLVHSFKFHSETTVTDVTVNGLCVTVKELSYEDFVNDNCPRYQVVKLPKNSDWNERFHGKRYEKQEKEKTFTDEEDDEIDLELQKINGSTNKQKLLEKFEEHIIQGLRPPSRPRSVDSYKNIMDKTMFGSNRSTFTDSVTPAKAVVGSLDDGNMKVNDFVNSPLKIIVDDCEEVDVVGGIESENHSYVSSLQSTRTTVTTQLQQSRFLSQSPVSNIIQSLLHSYSYNSSMEMPPLQAAPWVRPHEEAINGSPSFQMPSATNSHFLSRSSSLDPSLLKYNQSVPLSYYPQPPNFLSNLFMGGVDETPIDLSFK